MSMDKDSAAIVALQNISTGNIGPELQSLVIAATKMNNMRLVFEILLLWSQLQATNTLEFIKTETSPPSEYPKHFRTD